MNLPASSRILDLSTYVLFVFAVCWSIRKLFGKAWGPRFRPLGVVSGHEEGFLEGVRGRLPRPLKTYISIAACTSGTSEWWARSPGRRAGQQVRLALPGGLGAAVGATRVSHKSTKKSASAAMLTITLSVTAQCGYQLGLARAQVGVVRGLVRVILRSRFGRFERKHVPTYYPT